MFKILSGLSSTLLGTIAFLFGIAYQAGGRAPWLLAEVPLLFLALPRFIYLAISLGILAGGAGTLFSGILDVSSVSRFRTRLRAGQGPPEILLDEFQQLQWSDSRCRHAADCIIRAIAYPDAVASIATTSKTSLDEAVLSYKSAADAFASLRHLVQVAMHKMRMGDELLPDVGLPCVRVCESQKRSFKDLVTKVDLSSTYNSTPLLTQGDLIFACNGHLVTSEPQLRAIVSHLGIDASLNLHVLRHVKTSNHHPLTGLSNDLEWVAIQMSLPKYSLSVGLETSGTANTAIAVTSKPVVAQLVAPSHADLLRFICPMCGKQLKANKDAIGKKAKCPKCNSPVRVPSIGVSD